MGAAALVVLVMVLLNLAWCCKCMKTHIDPNDIFKKMEKDGDGFLQMSREDMERAVKRNLKNRVDQQKALDEQ